MLVAVLIDFGFLGGRGFVSVSFPLVALSGEDGGDLGLGLLLVIEGRGHQGLLLSFARHVVRPHARRPEALLDGVGLGLEGVQPTFVLLGLDVVAEGFRVDEILARNGKEHNK